MATTVHCLQLTIMRKLIELANASHALATARRTRAGFAHYDDAETMCDANIIMLEYMPFIKFEGIAHSAPEHMEKLQCIVNLAMDSTPAGCLKLSAYLFVIDRKDFAITRETSESIEVALASVRFALARTLAECK